MDLFKLFISELKYRLLGTLMAATAIVVSVLAITTLLYLLEDFDSQTESKVSALHKRSQSRMADLENEARVFAKSLGFNIFVFHKEQDLATFHANDVNTHYLTTQETRTLADSKFAYLNHLLPFLRHRYKLPAFGGEVIIAGLEGEIYIKRKFQKPLEVRVEPGQVQLGYTVATKLAKREGDVLVIGGSSYKVSYVRSQLGTKDDLMVFMNLGDAQKLLGLPNKVSGVLALSCNCTAGNIDPIRNGLEKIIPNASVVEFTIRARARQKARKAIKEAAEGEIKDILAARGDLRRQLKQFSLLFVTIVVAAAVLLLTFLYAHNVKERRHEIAILRTLGVRRSKIYALFIVKSFCLALVGATCGYSGGFILSKKLAEVVEPTFNPLLFLILLFVSMGVSVVASLVPVLVAIRRDPAYVLNEEA